MWFNDPGECSRSEPQDAGAAGPRVISNRRPTRFWRIGLAGLAALALVASACGGSDDEDSSVNADDSSDSATPVPGGSLVYGLEAATTGGWCLPESQLAISGIMVARAIYDTLTVPDEDAEYVPFLAESVEHNDDYTTWTIKLRKDIKFSDGSDLDSTVVKNNIDSWRGEYPGRNPLLLRFAYSNVKAVDVVDPLTVQVTTTTPWPSFAAYLYYQGRVGIMGQAQLDDKDHCDSNLVGTGPFVKQEWVPSDHFTAVKNKDYWRTDSDGTKLPYLDSVEFKPYPEASSRVNALLSNQLQAMHTTDAASIATLEDAGKAGDVSIEQSGEFPEVSYGLLNVAKAPFDNPLARKAAAAALDRAEIQKIINLDKFPTADGPFGPGEIGYLEDTGFPKYDPDEAKKLLKQYQDETGDTLEFTFTVQNTTEVIAVAQLIKSQAAKVGVKVNIEPVEQATLISRAIAGDFQGLSFRNHAGGDPDLQYIWWHTGSPTNFGNLDDPEIDKLLDEGRAEADKAKRKTIYEDLNRRFASEVYDIWLNWTVWTIANQTNVHDILGGPLPGGEAPFPGLADGHSLASAWISN